MGTIYLKMSSIRFCIRCDNKYYHQIQDNKLIYYCRVCGHQDLNIAGLCVLNTQYGHSTDSYEHVVNRFTKFDPTLPHIYLKCPNEKCTTKEITDAIYLRYEPNQMKHLYICTECDHKWTTT